MILCVDLVESTPKILLEDGNIPTLLLDNHPFSICNKICENLLEIDTKHIEYILIDFDYDKSTIYYTFMIPETIKTKQGQWQYIGAIDDPTIQKMVFKAGQETISKRLFGF